MKAGGNTTVSDRRSDGPGGKELQDTITAHAIEKGQRLRDKFGSSWSPELVEEVLESRAFTRFPCRLIYEDAVLERGELAVPILRREAPEDGYDLFVHPYFMNDPDHLPHVVFYQLVVVNYGKLAGPEQAECFGAAALGMDKDEFYKTLCELSDAIWTR